MLDGAHEDCQEFLIAAEIERKSGFVADRLTHSSIGQYCFFFFKQKTAYEMIWYWSSDVCSSDLPATASIGSLGIGSGSAISPNSASGPYREIQSEACSQARVPANSGYRSASMLQP